MKDIVLFYPGQERASLEALPPALQARTIVAYTEGELIRRLKDARILVGSRWPAHVLRGATNTEWMQALSAGVEQIVPMLPRNCRLTRIVGLFDEAIADWAMTFVHYFNQGVPRMLQQQKQGV